MTKDLFVLVADQDMKLTLEALLKRLPITHPEISSFSFEVVRHPNRDSGCLLNSTDFLRNFSGLYAHVLVIFDHEGCGREQTTPIDLEENLKRKLSNNGWDSRANAIVIDPELEQWMWTASPHVSKALSWGTSYDLLNTFLREEGFIVEGKVKPFPPKEAFEKALRKKRKPWSSSIFQKIATQASYRNCQERSFLKLVQVLREWFPAAQ